MLLLPMQERAESMQRVLAVDLLHLMAAEGSYGAQVAQQLDASEVWHAYRDQKHDLFLPAGSTSQVQSSSSIDVTSTEGSHNERSVQLIKALHVMSSHFMSRS